MTETNESAKAPGGNELEEKKSHNNMGTGEPQVNSAVSEKNDAPLDRHQVRALPDETIVNNDTKTNLTTNRREALFLVSLGALATGSAAFASSIVTAVKDAKGLMEEIGEGRRRNRRNDSLLRDIFFSGIRGEAPMVPGFNHAVFRAENAVRPEDDIASIRSLMSLFQTSPDFHFVDQLPIFNSPCGVIACGSPITNDISREILRPSENNKGCIESPDGRLFQLRFFHCPGPKHSPVRRILDGTIVEEPNHEIYDALKRTTYSSLLETGTKYPLNSYLLFSKVPHPRFDNHTAVVWAGNIGPGTEGATLVLQEDLYFVKDEIQEIVAFAAEHRYFQALFVVEDIVVNDKARRHIPRTCRLIRDGLHAVLPESK